MSQLGPGNNIALRLRVLSCENIGAVVLDGPQHQRFEDTLPFGTSPGRLAAGLRCDYIQSHLMEAKMLAFTNIAAVLGLPAQEAAARSPFALMSRIEDGLPIGALERVARLLAPGDAQFKYRLVPKATYERRKSAHRLSSDEGTRLARVARVWGLALDVWQSEDQARDFLFRPHPMLEDRRPIEIVIQSEIGAELVLDILGGLKYGTAA